MIQIIGGQDDVVAGWASLALGTTIWPPHRAFGLCEPDGLMLGAVIFGDFYPGGNVEFTFVGEGLLTRAVCRFIVDYAFNKLGASRLTAKTRRTNKVARKLLAKAGFLFADVKKRYYGPHEADDAFEFFMFRPQAEKWLGRNASTEAAESDQNGERSGGPEPQDGPAAVRHERGQPNGAAGVADL